MSIKKICGTGMLLMLLLLSAFGQVQGQKVFVLKLQDEVHASSARFISRGFEEAQKAGAALVIIHMDTYGGRVDFADSIRSDILDANMPTAVFIDRNAGSAGALISIACDSIYMAPGASIGAATVVNGGTGDAAPDKYQSYFRGVMRTTAELKGRDPRIAEKMVDQNLELEGISPKGQVITFSTQEAMKHGYCDGAKSSLREVAAEFGLENAEIVNFTGSTVDKLINWAINPAVSGFLLLLIFGGLFMEMKTPGVGFAGAVALIAMALFFLPHYIEGLAASWEIAVFLLGVVLIAVEILIIPGFGVPGVLGIVFTVVGLAAALLENKGLSLEGVPASDVLNSTALVLVMMVSGILVVIVLARHLATSRAAYPFVDGATQDREEGYTAVNNDILDLVGKEAIALTDLRPSGYIEVDGKQYDGEAEEGYIPKDSKVQVVKVRSINLIVRKI